MIETISPELITFFSAMLPVTELRGAIPFGIQVLKLSPWEAFVWGVAGNMVPNFFILWLLSPISKLLMKYSTFFNKSLTKLFEKTRKKHSDRFKKYGALFLIIFVAIPIPGSGGWTGSLIAFLFGIKYWHAVALISIGIILAGILITLGFGSIVAIVQLFTG